MMRTLKVYLVASGIGILAWLSGLTAVIWPAHPQFAAFVFTVIATVASPGVPAAAAGARSPSPAGKK